MTRFQDGPAAGKTLMLKRAPVYLRVTECNGKLDALDQLEDAPRPDERLFAYVITGEPGFIHLNTRGKPGGGFFTTGEYRLVEPQPPDSAMRTFEAWRAWTHAEGRPAWAQTAVNVAHDPK